MELIIAIAIIYGAMYVWAQHDERKKAEFREALNINAKPEPVALTPAKHAQLIQANGYDWHGPRQPGTGPGVKAYVTAERRAELAAEAAAEVAIETTAPDTVTSAPKAQVRETGKAKRQAERAEKRAERAKERETYGPLGREPFMGLVIWGSGAVLAFQAAAHIIR